MTFDLSVEAIEDELQAYIDNGEKKPADYAHVLGVTVDKLYKMVAVYKEKRMSEGFTLTEDTQVVRKSKTVLTDPQKRQVYEAYLNGGKSSSIAERFDCSENYIHKIVKSFKDGEKTYVAPSVIDQVLTTEDFLVEFEGDYLIIKLHKKHITRKLLAGVI